MTPDRVNYTFGMKINIGNYQSVDLHSSFSSDIKDGETPEEAYQRVVEFVESSISPKIDEVKEIYGQS